MHGPVNVKRWRIFGLNTILGSSWLAKRLSAFHDNLLHGVNLTGSTDQVALSSLYFRVPPQCSRSLRSSEMLCGVGCWLVTEVSRIYKGPMLKSWTVQDCLTLDGVDTFLPFEDEVSLDQWYYQINPLKPNDPYMGRTAPLTSKRCILYIYSTNIRTEYFKHAAHSPFYSLQNAIYFIMLPCLVLYYSRFTYSVC